LSLRRRAAPAALLFCLAGCPDPFRPAESGAFWLFEAADAELWDPDLMGSGLLKRPADGSRVHRSFSIGEADRRSLVERLRKGRVALRESERFQVVEGVESGFAVDDAVEFRFTFDRTATGARGIDYRLRWSGDDWRWGHLAAPSDPWTEVFVRELANGRYRVLSIQVSAAR
jgi:hypothetical protein